MNGYYLTNNNAKRRTALRKLLATHNQRNIMHTLKAIGAKRNVQWLNQFMVPNNFFDEYKKPNINMINFVSPNALVNLFKGVSIKSKKLGVRNKIRK